MTTLETTAAGAVTAKQLIFKIQDVLSLILAAAHAIAKGDLDDDQGPAAGIEAAAEDVRSMLYDLMDEIGLDKEEGPK